MITRVWYGKTKAKDADAYLRFAGDDYGKNRYYPDDKK